MPKVLLVEDEVDLREAMAEEIAEEGYEVQVAQNGLRALEQLANYVPDIIVSDISMPEMDGFAFLESLRSAHTHLDDVPFVFLSAFNAKDDVIKGKKLGADDYLVKPVDFELLFATIEARLGQVQRMTERKEAQFVKLYHTLQSNQQAAGSDEQKPDPVEDDGRERVYGRCLNFESLVSIFNRFNQNKQQTLDDFIRSILDTSIPPEIELDSTIPGLIFMYGADPSHRIVMEENLFLDQLIQKKLYAHEIGQTITNNFGQLVLGKDLRIRDIPFDTRLDKELLEDGEQRSKALLQKLRAKYSDKEFLQERTKNVREQSDIFEANFHDNKGQGLNMKFFHFDELSENYLQTAIAFCGTGSQKAIDFLRDLTFLELLPGKIGNIDADAIVVIDVHYETVSKPEKLAQYRMKYESVVAEVANKIYLNVRGLPHNIDLGKCANLVQNCKIRKSGWIAQFNPWLDMGLEVDQLKVPYVVWSMNDIYGTQASLSHYKKQKSAYKLCGSSLLLRDIPSSIDVSEFKAFDFDGYSINQ
ncbi:MAG: response regulator transcription factor [Methyloligellaceae bacterium]